jgi:hypothetical protein
MNYTYLIKQGSELWMYSNDKEMPRLPKIELKNSTTTVISYGEKNSQDYDYVYEKWLSSCNPKDGIQVHPSEVDKVRKYIYLLNGIDITGYLHYESLKVEQKIETRILIPSGALRVEKECSHCGFTGLCYNECDLKEYAFLNEETKETFIDKCIRETQEKIQAELEDNFSRTHDSIMNPNLKAFNVFSKYMTESKEESQEDMWKEIEYIIHEDTSDGFFLSINALNIIESKFLITRRENK